MRDPERTATAATETGPGRRPVHAHRLPLLASCGCGSGCSCGCQSGGGCQCGGGCA